MAALAQNSEAFYERASATLLSQQRASKVAAPPVPAEKRQNWNTLRGHLEARLNGLRSWRESWWTQNWSLIAEYLLPRRSIWMTQSTGGYPTPNNMTRGRTLNQSIKDSTGTYALRVCSAGLMSGLASPSRPWFKITPKIKNFQVDEEGRKWMDDVEDRIYAVMANSNFYNSFAVECEDLTAFGTAPTIIYEDAADVIRCYNPANGEFYLASDATVRVNGLYRQFAMTVSQIVDFFGIDKCPEGIQNLWKAKGNSLDQEQIIAHCIEPNFDVKGTGKIPGNFAYREVYWVYGAGSSEPLSTRGFVDPPFTAARWATQSNDPYGRSPGMDVVPDVIQLQVMTVRLSEAIEKQVRPPLLADASLKNQPSSALPGHVTYAQDIGQGRGMRPIYEVNPDIKGMEALIEKISQRIQKGLFNDLFAMFEEIPQGKMTAYETAQRVQDRLQRIGPVIENLLAESLKPKLKRIYGIMERKKMLPPPPDSMKGVPLDVEFVSLLALAQKAASTGGLERITAFIGNLAGVYPEAKFKLDVETAIDEMNELLGNPQKIIRSTDEAQKMGQQEQQAMQHQQQAAQAGQVADTAKTGADAANVLSQTQIGGGQNALAAIFGQGQG